MSAYKHVIYDCHAAASSCSSSVSTHASTQCARVINDECTDTCNLYGCSCSYAAKSWFIRLRGASGQKGLIFVDAAAVAVRSICR